MGTDITGEESPTVTQSFEFVAVRLLGLYAIIHALVLFSALSRLALLPGNVLGSHGWQGRAFILLPFALLLALAYTFTAHPVVVAGWLQGERSGDPLPAPLTHLAFIVAGVVILGDALPDLSRLLTSYSAARPEFVAGVVCQIVLGLLALFRPESMAGPLRRGRVPAADYSLDQLGPLALSVVGIVLFASAVPFLVPAFMSYFWFGISRPDQSIVGALYVEAPKALLGLGLFFFPREIMKPLAKRL